MKEITTSKLHVNNNRPFILSWLLGSLMSTPLDITLHLKMGLSGIYIII